MPISEKTKMIAFANKFRKHLNKHGNVKEKRFDFNTLYKKSAFESL